MEIKPIQTLKSPADKARVTNPSESAKKKGESNKLTDVSKDSSCSSGSASSGSLVRKETGYRSRRRLTGPRPVKVVPEPVKVSIEASLLLSSLLKRRCTWITPYSGQVYVSFHDEEWGVPVHDDRKLFELLIFSEALAELNWPAILIKREIFRKLFDNFDPSSVAKFTEKKIISLRSSGTSVISEQKLRAVVENAKQMLKIVEEFGSFSCYCWSFVNRKPIINGFRYARQVPIKSPKAEAMSKDLMQRGFRCVGPSVIYSFMQAAGIVNDHLSSCFRYGECLRPHVKELKANTAEVVATCKLTDEPC